MPIGWSSWTQRAAGFSPPANVEVLPHPTRTASHLPKKNPSTPLQLRQHEVENGDPRGRDRPERCGSPSPTGMSGRTGSHPRMRRPCIHAQLPQLEDEYEDTPGRYRHAGCGNPNPAGSLLIGWGSWSQRPAIVEYLSNVEVSPHPVRIEYHPSIRNASRSLQP